MSKKSALDSIEVKTSCSADWNEMLGSEEARFCGHCAKNVHNLSAMTRRDAKKIVAAANGKLCVRYIRRPDTKQIQSFAGQPILVKIIGRTTRIAAGVFGATLTLATASAVYAQQSEVNISGAPQKKFASYRKNAKKPNADGSSSQITVTIVDSMDAVVPGSQVTLTNDKTNEKFTVTTNEEGAAFFAAVPHGRYEISVIGTPGFNSFSGRFIEIQNAVEPDVKITLEVGALMGVVALAWYELPLARAVAQNDAESVRRLIADGANVRAKDENMNSNTALHAAVEAGNAEIARLLLDAGAKVNARNKSKETPLLMIDEDATAELVRLLIERGANVNAQSDEGETALMRAADDDKIEIVKVLLEAGANPHLADDDGDTALSEATNEEIESILKTYGAR